MVLWRPPVAGESTATAIGDEDEGVDECFEGGEAVGVGRWCCGIGPLQGTALRQPSGMRIKA